MNRRGFLSAILAAGVAPAVVGSSILMPVRMILPVLYGDGITDDTRALQAWFRGRDVISPDGKLVGNAIGNGVFLTSDTIYVDDSVNRWFCDNKLMLAHNKPWIKPTT